MFFVGYLVVTFIVAVIFTLAAATTMSIDEEPKGPDWLIGGLFGLMGGLLWPLTLLVWGIGAIARKLYYASKENINV